MNKQSLYSVWAAKPLQKFLVVHTHEGNLTDFPFVNEGKETKARKSSWAKLIECIVHEEVHVCYLTIWQNAYNTKYLVLAVVKNFVSNTFKLTIQKLIHCMCLLSFYMLKYDKDNKEGIFISVKTVE